MSLIPEIGHLYHDFSISNAYTTLDAREQLRTRQINAREDKQLGKFTEVIDKAKDICKRRREWEEDTLRRQLRVLQMKTPSLDRGLRQETERLRRYETSMMSRNSSSGLGIQSRITSFSEKPTLHNNQWSSRTMTSFPQSSRSGRREDSHTTSMSSRESNNSGSTPRSDCHTENQVNFMKRAENVTKELHKLYRRQKERRSSNQHLLNLMRSNNKELLMKARIFFKDEEATAVLESILNGDNSQQNGVKFHRDITSLSDGEEEYNEMTASINIEKDPTKVMGNDSVKENSAIPLRQDHSDTESGPISSTIANASDNDSQVIPGRTKWTEIFKTPELWKMYVNESNTRKAKKDSVSPLVTITARYRRTMVR